MRLVDATLEDVRRLIREELDRKVPRDDAYVSVEEAARRLSVSKSTIERILRDHHVPILHVRGARRLKFSAILVACQAEGPNRPDLQAGLAKALRKSG